MGGSDLRTKHLIGTPAVTFNGHKAIIELNAVIVAENVRLGYGCSVHIRFYDFAEKRSDEWKLLKRQSVVSVPRTPSSRPTLNLRTSCPLQ